MSKAFSLAGIRIGWIASRSREMINTCAAARDYTTISVSQIDDQVATFALSAPTVHKLLLRNIETARTNLAALEAFVKQFEWACTWVRPRAGTTAFVKFVDKNGKTVDDVQFCERLQARMGVLLTPGSQCFGGGIDFKGFVRFGYVPETQVLIEGLQALGQFMKGEYEDLPVV
jgi:aspartate/methionine/tyrosine aminotransferase